MNELPIDERVRRLIGAADRKRAQRAVGTMEDRADELYRVCLSACQTLDARPDGREARLRQEPPATDYRQIWTRLNRQWREQHRV